MEVAVGNHIYLKIKLIPVLQRDTGLDQEQVESLQKAFEDEAKRKNKDNSVNATSVGVILKVGDFRL